MIQIKKSFNWYFESFDINFKKNQTNKTPSINSYDDILSINDETDEEDNDQSFAEFGKNENDEFDNISVNSLTANY